MTILDLVLEAYGIVGTGFSIAGGIASAIKEYYKTTAEDLFKSLLLRWLSNTRLTLLIKLTQKQLKLVLIYLIKLLIYLKMMMKSNSHD